MTFESNYEEHWKVLITGSHLGKSLPGVLGRIISFASMLLLIYSALFT